VSHGGTPPEERIRERESRRTPEGRDVTPAVGRRGGPGRWQRAVEGARVALAHLVGGGSVCTVNLLEGTE
jgi:hypothetical protein